MIPQRLRHSACIVHHTLWCMDMRYSSGSIHDLSYMKNDVRLSPGKHNKRPKRPPAHEKCSLSRGEVFCLDVMRYCHAVVQCRASRATPMRSVPFHNVLALDQFPLPSIALKPHYKLITSSHNLHKTHTAPFRSPPAMNRIKRRCIKWDIKKEKANV